MNQMGALFFAKAPGRMAFVIRDNVKVGGCVWRHTAATGISKGMIRNGIFAGIWLSESSKVAINPHVTLLIDE
jgi:hypothetical protein